MSRPSICFVSQKIHHFLRPGSEAGAGGAERQQHLLGKGLRDRGYAVNFVTGRFGDGSPREIDGFDVYPAIPNCRGLRGVLPRGVAVFRALHRSDADVYYSRGNPFISILTALYCLLVGRAFVYAVANDAHVEPSHLRTWNPLYRRCFLAAIRSAAVVVTLTPHQQRVLDREHGIPARTIPCGYDVPPESAVLPATEREFVLWVGRIARDQKRPERFLRLAERLPPIEFVMVGPPNEDEEAYYEHVREEASTIDNLRFEGFVSPDDIESYFRRASVLVNTSDYEGFGNVFLEAWRYATPVVSIHYDLDGVLRERRGGIVADDAETLTDTVKQLAADTDRRSEMGSAGRDLLIERYSLESVVDDYADLFESVSETS